VNLEILVTVRATVCLGIPILIPVVYRQPTVPEILGTMRLEILMTVARYQTPSNLLAAALCWVQSHLCYAPYVLDTGLSLHKCHVPGVLVAGEWSRWSSSNYSDPIYQAPAIDSYFG